MHLRNGKNTNPPPTIWTSRMTENEIISNMNNNYENKFRSDNVIHVEDLLNIISKLTRPIDSDTDPDDFKIGMFLTAASIAIQFHKHVDMKIFDAMFAELETRYYCFDSYGKNHGVDIEYFRDNVWSIIESEVNETDDSS